MDIQGGTQSERERKSGQGFSGQNRHGLTVQYYIYPVVF